MAFCSFCKAEFDPQDARAICAKCWNDRNELFQEFLEATIRLSAASESSRDAAQQELTEAYARLNRYLER